jgi:hypothetical protein
VPFRYSALFRAIGLINLLLCAFGLYGWLTGTARWLSRPFVDPKQPYFYQAYFAIGAFNLLFNAVIFLTSLDLLRLRLEAVRLYLWMVIALISYNFVNGGLWLLPDPIGRSIAGATGVGNIGIEPFEFALFFIPWGWPVLSLVALYFVRKKLTGHGLFRHALQSPAP